MRIEDTLPYCNQSVNSLGLSVETVAENHVSFCSLTQSEKDRYICESSAALNAKLRSYYGEVPSDEELWGIRFKG